MERGNQEAVVTRLDMQWWSQATQDPGPRQARSYSRGVPGILVARLISRVVIVWLVWWGLRRVRETLDFWAKSL